MLSFKCGDVGFDCDYIVQEESEEELIEKVKIHGKNDHRLHESDFTPTLIKDIKKNILQS